MAWFNIGSDLFAARAAKLSAIAKQAVAAKARGDWAELERLMQLYAQAAGKVDPKPLIDAAYEAESPSALAVTLDNISGSIIGGAKTGLVVLVLLSLAFLWLWFRSPRAAA